MELKEGQVYRRIEMTTPAFTKGRYYRVMLDGGCEPYLESDGAGRWYGDDIDSERFELVEEQKPEVVIPLSRGGLVEEPTPDPTSDVKPVSINVENLMEHIIINKLEVNEILSYLDGYVEGSRF